VKGGWGKGWREGEGTERRGREGREGDRREEKGRGRGLLSVPPFQICHYTTDRRYGVCRTTSVVAYVRQTLVNSYLVSTLCLSWRRIHYVVTDIEICGARFSLETNELKLLNNAQNGLNSQSITSYKYKYKYNSYFYCAPYSLTDGALQKSANTYFTAVGRLK